MGMHKVTVNLPNDLYEKCANFAKECEMDVVEVIPPMVRVYFMEHSEKKLGSVIKRVRGLRRRRDEPIVSSSC